MNSQQDSKGWMVIGVPTSAGAHHAGQERAPAALRAAGLADRLQTRGLTVADAGDLPVSVFAVDHEHPRARNLAAVVKVAREVADAVASAVEAGLRPLVLGGDCTITLGVIAGFRQVHPGTGLAYVDGDVDLGAVSAESSGILDATGIWHLLGYGEPELAGLAGNPPLLDPSRLAIVGCDPREVTEDGRRFLADHRVSYTDGPGLIADPEAAGRKALAALAGSGPMVVHFDVDVVDSGDLPLGNFPHYNSGVRLTDVERCLRVLLADASCAGLVLTEVNPTYDPDGSQLDRYLEALTTALAG
ncbi:MAG TPA: arginase family protein [Streptosporangiaceae bacterium]|nr:arginase family protein [Streptosporangiaceae bacterium]